MLTQGILHSTDTINDKEPVTSLTVKGIRAKAMHFADLALQCIFIFNQLIDYDLLQFSPSVISVACILLARVSACITPLWSPYLQYFTGYEFEQIKDCYLMLQRFI